MLQYSNLNDYILDHLSMEAIATKRQSFFASILEEFIRKQKKKNVSLSERIKIPI